MNKYEVIDQAGEGAYGIVLKCKNKVKGSLVAVKRFKDMDDPTDVNYKNTVLREIKILKNSVHPNIVKLIEAFKRKQRLYLVFEYCENTILDLLEKQKGIFIDDAKYFAFQILRATDFLHQNHIIHRDLKPENLLVRNYQFQDGTEAQVVKVCDFGFARYVNVTGNGNEQQQGDLTSYVATRWYRAPELLLNAHDYTSSVDIWAIALIIVEMITGQPLFPGDSDVDQLYIIQKVLGNMTRKQMECFLSNPKFMGLKMPDQCGRVEGLEKMLSGKIKDPKLLTLLDNMLRIEPSQRWTAQQCLQSEWFDSVRQRCLQLELQLYQEMDIQQQNLAASLPKPEERTTSAGEPPKSKSRNRSRDVKRSVSPAQHFSLIGNMGSLVSIGVPSDLPQLPASKGGSRGIANRGAASNYMYFTTTKNSYGLPGLPKYK